MSDLERQIEQIQMERDELKVKVRELQAVLSATPGCRCELSNGDVCALVQERDRLRAEIAALRTTQTTQTAGPFRSVKEGQAYE
jgi:hypothetical protein